jgi:peptidoglycan/LPS O-acetylase OafA/YrhL
VNWENGAAGVDIFFIISGFVMVISSRRFVDRAGTWLIFLRHRAVRIVPLYWLLTTVKIIAVAILGGVVLRTGLGFNFVTGSYLFLPVTDSAGHFRPVLPVGWTLTYEFLFYLLFAAALLFPAWAYSPPWRSFAPKPGPPGPSCSTPLLWNLCSECCSQNGPCGAFACRRRLPE